MAQDHESFQVLLDFLVYLRRSSTQGGLVEKVMGFGFQLSIKKWRATSFCFIMPFAWAAWFVGQLEDLGFVVKIIKLDNSLFMDVPGERTGGCLCLWYCLRVFPHCVVTVFARKCFRQVGMRDAVSQAHKHKSGCTSCS